MKRYFLIPGYLSTFLFVMIFISACSSSNKKDVIGNWKITRGDLSNSVLTFAEDGNLYLNMQYFGKYSFIDENHISMKTKNNQGIYSINISGNEMTLKDPDSNLSTYFIKISSNEVDQSIQSEKQGELISTNRDAVISDLNKLAALAQQYWEKPVSLGGGGSSFIGWSISSGLQKTNNGNYSIISSNYDKIELRGVGNFKGKDNINNIEVICSVSPKQISISVKN